jgi:hypothetical protein
MNKYIFEIDLGSKTVTETVVAACCEEAWVVAATRLPRFGKEVRSLFLIDPTGTPYKPKE